MSATQRGSFNPDYSVHPGMLLEQELDVRGLSQAEFARRIARTPKLVSEIIAGKNPVEPETALQFERVLGINADLWLSMEAQYRLSAARAAEDERLSEAAPWLSRFPTKDLARQGVIPKSASVQEQVRQLLGFFGVASPSAFEARYASAVVQHRRSKAFAASREAGLAWLRLGEIIAEREPPPRAFDRILFREALTRIRSLTDRSIDEFVPEVKALCRSAGVAFVIVPALPKTRVSGAAFWTGGSVAVLQQSLRHKTNDHFWFTFFHEAGHILLHGNRRIFIDDDAVQDDGLEREADEFAVEMLLGRRRFEEFLRSHPRGAAEVRAFAESTSVHPGIVVGMLQHTGAIPWSHLNALKARLEWTPERG